MCHAGLFPEPLLCCYATDVCFPFRSLHMLFQLQYDDDDDDDNSTQHTHAHNHFRALWTLSGTTWVSRYQKNIHPFTPVVVISHPLSASCLVYMPGCLFPQSLSQSFFGLPLGLAPSTSPNHCLLFTSHTHTIAACFPVVLRLCHQILVSQPLTWNSIL